MISWRWSRSRLAGIVVTGLLVAGASFASELVAVQLERAGSEPALGAPLAPADPAARAVALQTLGAGGLLLIPDSTNKRVMAFDPATGDLVDADFVPSDPAHLSTPIEAIVGPDGRTLLVSDQVADAVFEYEIVSGAFVRLFAPAGGVNNAILNNIRGIALRQANLLVANAGATNDDSVAMFDSGGSYVGNFVGTGIGGLDGPFDVTEVSVSAGLLSAGEWLVPGDTSDAIHHYDFSGAALANLAAVNSFPEQVVQIANGNVLVANFSGTQQGVLELDANGAVVGVYKPAALSGFRGVHQLPNGNILTTTGNGVYEIDRLGAVIETKISGVSARFVSKVGPWVHTTPTPAVALRFDTEVHGSRMYMLGYRTDGAGATDGSVWAYDLATSAWSDTLTDMPVPVSNTTIARLTDSHGTGLYLFGGRVGTGACTTTVQAYYPADNSTATLAADPWPGTVGGATVFPGGVEVVGNKAYLWGGFCGGTSAPYTSSQTWIFDPLAPAGSRWTPGRALPSPGAYQSSAALDGKVYSLGGDSYDGSSLIAYAAVLMLDPANLGAGWQPRAAIPTPVSGTPGCGESRAFGFDTATSWELAGKIVLVGCGQWPNPSPESFVYNRAADTWASFAPLILGRRTYAAAFLPDSAASGRMWVGGGYVPPSANSGTDAAETFLVSSSALLSDGFESGDLGAWPGVRP